MDGYQIVSEALLISGKNTEYRVDDFIKGKTQFLFIIGTPGSGKTALSNQEYNKYDILHLDNFFRKHVDYKKDNVEDQILNAWNILIKDIKTHKGQLVIEGIQCCWLFEDIGYDIARNNSIIILNTSFLKSVIIRVGKQKKDSSWLYDFIVALKKGYLKKSINMWAEINSLIKKIKREII